jgi:uncharacterized protein YqeY
MTVAEQLRTDITTAMKAGEKTRVGALRLVLSELQRDSKEGAGDELAVLRRERKRRLDAAAQFRDGGRPELAEQEESEARMIEGYLPAELDDSALESIVTELIATYLPAELGDDELQAIVAQAIADTGATGPRDMGQVMKAVMAASKGQADGKRASASVREALKA